jgi:hypothetical protein
MVLNVFAPDFDRSLGGSLRVADVDAPVGLQAPPSVPQAPSRFTMIIAPPKRLRTPAKAAKIKGGS